MKKAIQLSNMKEDNKLASKNAAFSSFVDNFRLYSTKDLYRMAMSREPIDEELAARAGRLVEDIISEIVPVENDDVLFVATERFLMTDLDLTFDEFTEAKEQLYDKLYHRMKQTGLVSGRDEFQQSWDEASKLLQQVDREIGGPLIC